MAVAVLEFRPYVKQTLRGFLTVRLTNVGLEIRDLALHKQNGKRWLQLPARPYTKPDGSQGWSYLVSFYEKTRFEQFREVALRALDEYRRQAEGNERDRRS